MTAEDVAWTFDTLRDKGRPFYRQYYADVASVRCEGAARVVFRFKSAANRELPLILGQMPVLPKHWWAGREFDTPLTDPPLGSGPYRVGHFEFGRTSPWKRVPDGWSATCRPSAGLNNFDTMRYRVFPRPDRGARSVQGRSDRFPEENIAKEWATAYDFPAVQKGLVKKEVLPTHCPPACRATA